MRGLPRARWLAGAAVLAVSLAACGGGGGAGGGSTPGAAAATGGTFSVEICEPKSLVPTNTAESCGSQVINALFTPLVTYDPTSFEPKLTGLTKSITTTDNTTWTITLNSGWKFHDGTPVTSDSFIDAWNFAALGKNAQDNNYFFEKFAGYADLNPKSGEPKATQLSGLKKVSDTEFTVTLNGPYSAFKGTLGYSAYFPMPKAAFQDIKKYNEAPIGNGPFQMDGTWNHDQSIKVKAFPDYKGTKPKVDGIDFKIYQKLDTAYNDLLANNLDIMTSIPTSQIASAPQQLGNRYQESPNSVFQFLGIPTYDTKYGKVEIRKAISMAIDRPAIIKTIFNGSQQPADDFVSPVIPGYRKGACGESCTFNPQKAQQLLAAAGGLAGNSMTITYNADGGHKDWVDAACNQIQQNLKVTCTGVPKEKFSVMLKDLKAAEQAKTSFGPFRLGWIMDYPTMEDYLAPLYGTGGSSNYSGYSNKEFDALVTKGNEAKTEQEAIKFYQQADDILAKDLPVIPLWYGKNRLAISTKVANVKLDAFSNVIYTEVTVKK